MRLMNLLRPMHLVTAKQPGQEEQVVAICSLGINLFAALMTYLKPVLPAMAHEAEAFLGVTLQWQTPPQYFTRANH